MMKYPGTDLQTYNLDWVIQEAKRLAKANGIEFNDENIHIGADNVQEAIDALYDLVMEISSQTNAVEVIDSSILESTWATGYTYTHLQTVNTPTLMAIVNAMRLSKSIILRRDVATNDEAAFVLLEVTYDPILFKHELKFVNPYIHKVATLNIFGLDDDANVYAEILPDVTVKYVNAFNGRSGNVTPAAHDYDAEQVDYNNAGSGLQATDIQAAIDEVDDKIPSNIVETFNGRSGAVNPAAHDYDAEQVDYDNTTSGLSATDVQAAIDELVANPPAPVAADIDYSNTTSGLQATNVQDALDEIANDVLSSGVASFNGRSGAVNPVAHDYDAEQIDYDNTTSGLSATDTQGAIDELAAAIPTDVLGDLSTEIGNPISITTDSEQIARSTKIMLLPIQAAGTPTASDPIPISGYDKVELTLTGKNLIIDNIPNATVNSSGVVSSVSSAEHVIVAPVVAGVTYTFSKSAASNIAYGFYYDLPSLGSISYNDSRTTLYAGTSEAFTAPITGFIAINNQDAATDEQIEVGSPTTAYEPYSEATQISLSLPETVYGGELDVETGMLKVDRGIFHADGTGGNYGVLYNSTYSKYYVTVVRDLQSVDTGEGDIDLISSRFNTSAVTSEGNAFITASGHYLIAVLPDQTITTEAGARAWFEDNPTDFVYPLATPTEIQLTPYEVELLLGANVITTNGTSITLVYREGEIAALSDVKAVNDFLKADLDTLDAEAVKQTSGELDAKLSANQTAAAVLSNLMLRDIKFQTTSVTPGGDATEPDGTLIVVYEP